MIQLNYQISGRNSICDPLTDNNVWTMLLGISDDLSNKRILLVTTKVSTCLYDAKISWCALIRIEY